MTKWGAVELDRPRKWITEDDRAALSPVLVKVWLDSPKSRPIEVTFSTGDDGRQYFQDLLNPSVLFHAFTTGNGDVWYAAKSRIVQFSLSDEDEDAEVAARRQELEDMGARARFAAARAVGLDAANYSTMGDLIEAMLDREFPEEEEEEEEEPEEDLLQQYRDEFGPEPEATDYECPRCNADVGRPCVTADGISAQAIHIPRKRLALEQFGKREAYARKKAGR